MITHLYVLAYVKKKSQKCSRCQSRSGGEGGGGRWERSRSVATETGEAVVVLVLTAKFWDVAEGEIGGEGERASGLGAVAPVGFCDRLN